jgi:hypothetical protein
MEERKVPAVPKSLPLRKNKIFMQKELFQYSCEKYGIWVVEVSVKYKMFEGAGAVEWRSKCVSEVIMGRGMYRNVGGNLAFR